jgi:glycogen synthase
MTTEGVIEAIGRALELYRKEEEWEDLQRSVMEEDHSWKASAEEYVEKTYRKS